MSRIDLDPASCEVANKRVLAQTFFDKEHNGLTRNWHGCVWLNPPGGKVRNKSNAALWWAKLVDEYRAERVIQAIFLGFTLEILATSQDAAIWIGHVPFCVPRSRIAFLTESGQVGSSPPHSNVIAYLPPRRNRDAAVFDFRANFKQFGKVTNG